MTDDEVLNKRFYSLQTNEEKFDDILNMIMNITNFIEIMLNHLDKDISAAIAKEVNLSFHDRVKTRN